MQRLVTLTGFLIVGVCLAGVAHGQQPGAAPTDVVATVGDSPIFRGELDAVLQRAADVGTLRGVTDAAGGGNGRRQWLEALALEQLMDQRLLRREIQRERVVVGALEIDERLEQLKKQAAARNIDWEQFLAQAGLEERALREQIELEIALDKFIRPKLTPAAIAAGMESHRREVDGSRLRVSHIVLRPDAAFGEEGVAATLDKAAKIRLDILQGATTFAEAARRHSAGPSRERGGDLGWIGIEGQLLDVFVKNAFALAKGDVSKPFATPFGVHVVQVTAIEPGRVSPATARAKLESLMAAKLLREVVARLRATTPVSFGPGVAHFDPATPAGSGGQRLVVVEDGSTSGGASPP